MGKHADFNTLVEKEAQRLKSAGLLGLVRQLQGKVAAHRIRKLNTTYLTLPLMGIAKQVELAGPQEASALVLKCARPSCSRIDARPD